MQHNPVPGLSRTLLSTLALITTVVFAPIASCEDNTLSRYTPHQVFKGPQDSYKITGMAGTPYGLFILLSNVYRGTDRSRIYLDFSKIYEGDEETIGKPVLWGDRVIFPVEQSSRVLVYDGETIVPGAATHGRWSVAAALWQNRPIVTYNDDFGPDLIFRDRPVVHDAVSGEHLWTFDTRAMPRSMVSLGGRLYTSFNFGDHALVERSADGSMRKAGSDAVTLASHQGNLYGGGGSRWGTFNDPGEANGKVYVLDPGKLEWRTLFDTGSASIQDMLSHDGRLWVAGADPDRLHVIEADGSHRMVAEIPGETPADRQRSFGTALAVQDGHIYWGRSDLENAYVYRMDPAAGVETVALIQILLDDSR
jgi:hypothetical protein